MTPDPPLDNTNDELREAIRKTLFNTIVDALEIGQRLDYIGLSYNQKADLIEKLQDMQEPEILAAVAHSNQALINKVLEALPSPRPTIAVGKVAIYNSAFPEGYNFALRECRKVIEDIR